MKAVAIQEYGENEKVQLMSMPEPKPKDDEVLIEIRAAGVGQWDSFYRSTGLDLGVSQFPKILGWEGAGVVRETGKAVTRFKLGDHVYFYDYPSSDRPGGAWAEKVCIPEVSVGHMPKKLDFLQAGGLPIAAMTPFQAFTGSLGIQPGMRVLITGGAGGVGTCAVQIAHRLGAEVIALSSEKNFDYIFSLGADAVFDYHEDFLDDLLSQYPRNIDLIYHCSQSDETAAKVIPALKQGGVFCTITSFPKTLASRLDVTAQRCDLETNGMMLEEISKWVDDGNLKLSIQAIYPLEKAKEALAEVEAGHVRGKIVLMVREAG